MIRHSPAEFYLKFLLSHPDKYNDEKIEGVCKELGIDWLGPRYIEKLKRQLHPPIPFYPEDPLHLPSQSFLRKEMISKIFNPDKSMRRALEILDKPRIRELVEALVISGAPHEELVRALNRRFNGGCSIEAIDLYRHYFWNIDLLDATEFRALLQLRFSATPSDLDQTSVQQSLALKRASFLDARMVASKLPASPITAILAQMQLGVLPKEIPIADVMTRTRDAAALRAYEAVMNGGPNGANMAQAFSMTASVMNEMIETVVKPEDKLNQELRGMLLKTDNKVVPLLQSVTGGAHTTELQVKSEEPVDAEFEDEEESDAS